MINLLAHIPPGAYFTAITLIFGILMNLREIKNKKKVNKMDDAELVKFLNQSLGTFKSKAVWLKKSSDQNTLNLFGVRIFMPIFFSLLLFIAGLLSIFSLGWNDAVWQVELTLPAITIFIVMIPNFFIKRAALYQAIARLSEIRTKIIEDF